MQLGSNPVLVSAGRTHLFIASSPLWLFVVSSSPPPPPLSPNFDLEDHFHQCDEVTPPPASSDMMSSARLSEQNSELFL